MPNSDTSAARSFHDATKLSYISLATKPPLYKSYPGLPSVDLPAEMPSPDAPTLPAVAGVMSPSQGPLDLSALAQVLHYSAGLIRRSTLRTAGEVHYRAAASAGALYPIELYVVCGDLPGLAAGVYHYSPETSSLSLLRSGDHRGNLSDATADNAAVADAPATIVCTSVFWRSAWKYRERGYRYCYWDNGTILANMTATANALGQPAEIVAGFVDAEVDALLGLESSSEASFCLVPVGAGDAAPKAVGSPGPVAAGVLGVERRTEYPETTALHTGSVLTGAAGVAEWRNSGLRDEGGRDDFAWPDSQALGSTIAHRGSTRRFAREAHARRATGGAAGRVHRTGALRLRRRAHRHLPDHQRRRGNQPRNVFLLGPARGAVAVAGGGRVPRGGGAPLLRAGPRGRLQRRRLLHGRPRGHPVTLRQPGLPVGATGGRHHRRANVPFHPCHGPRGDGNDLLRRRRNRILLAPRGGQEPDVPGRPGPDPRAQPGTPFPFTHRRSSRTRWPAAQERRAETSPTGCMPDLDYLYKAARL